jgi:phosphoribosylanthranilate isomerase
MTLSIKICGLKTLPTLNAALDGGASHIGFIFFPKSPRNVAPTDAAALREAARGRAQAVAVTVDADNATLDEIVSAMSPDMLQLHGHETPERVKEIRARFGLPVAKALSVRTSDDLVPARLYADIADHLLLDAKPPVGADLPGGNGVSFDWTILRDATLPLPYFLSGGLHPGNVAEAIRIAKPAGIDVSSGVESVPGTKSIGLVHAFLSAARAAAKA